MIEILRQRLPASRSPRRVKVIGAGLAGCEAALQLAHAGIEVELVEQRPVRRSQAHQGDGLAELVCSNSLRSDQLQSAVGLLKHELRRAGSALLACADATRVPAGAALAVDRDAFSAAVERAVAGCERIHLVRRPQERVPKSDTPTIIATGPLTSDALAADLGTITGAAALHFYDAIAPILDAESIDRSALFAASRYAKGEGDDYLNIPLNKDGYVLFVQALLDAPKVTPHGFEERACFEGCLPVEVLAARGLEVLAHGPMKPVGLRDPSTGLRPHAVVQLRMENAQGSAYNMVGFQTRMTQAGQKQVFRSLPGLQQARFLRFGSIHRNSYVDAPVVLDDSLRLRRRPNVWLGGQLAGSEGYVEAIATGFLAATSAAAQLAGLAFDPPPATTALGGLYRHLRGASLTAFAPSNVNWGMIEPYPTRLRKSEKRQRMAERASADLARWLSSEGNSPVL